MMGKALTGVFASQKPRSRMGDGTTNTIVIIVIKSQERNDGRQNLNPKTSAVRQNTSKNPKVQEGDRWQVLKLE